MPVNASDQTLGSKVLAIPVVNKTDKSPFLHCTHTGRWAINNVDSVLDDCYGFVEKYSV